ncbi:MAG: Calx-beta domain-containing protein [Gemmataceae bacterium]
MSIHLPRRGRKPLRCHALPLRLETLEVRETPSGVPTTWNARGAGGGGALFSPAINPANLSELYVASDMSDQFRSTDAGATWAAVDWRQLQSGHEARVQFTENASIRYALDYTNDIQRPTVSNDGGATWHVLANDPTGGGALYFFADPHDHNRLLISDYTHLYFSANGGTTWQLKYTTANTNAGLLVGGTFYDGSSIYVGTNAGILVSNDSGANFAAAAVGGIPASKALIAFTGAKVGTTTRFVAVVDDVADVYAGLPGYDNNGGTAVYTLDVGQANWTPRTLPAGVWPFYAGMAENNINIAYVAGGGTASNPTVYKTTDGGATWTSVLQTQGNVNVQTGWSGSGGDRDWSYGELALGFTVALNDANQLIITDFGFAHASTDGGATWKNLNVAPADLNPAGASTPRGRAYHSSGLDNSTAWQVAWSGPTNLFLANSDVRGQLSTDSGQTFGFGYSGHTRNSMYRLATTPLGTLYAATSSVHDLYQSTYLTDSLIDNGNGAVLTSSDRGVTWTTIHDFGHIVSWVATDPTNPNRLYASVVHSTQGGIYVTNNLSAGAASTWTKLTNPPRTEGHPLDIVVLNDGTLVVTYSGRRAGSPVNFTASSGVFVSTDGGTTWADRSDPNMQYWTKDVVIDPSDSTQNTWWAGVWSGYGGAANNKGGLYKTTNRGVTWTRVIPDTQITRVTSITFNPADANEAFVTSETQGLWYSNNIHAAQPTFTQVASYPFRQPERVFFNPYNSNEIWVTSFGNGIRVGTTTAVQAGALQLSASQYSVAENAGTVTITVSRVGGSTGAVSVQYATGIGSATAGSDYTATSGTLTWADGDTSPKTFTVAILDDTIVETNETFPVALSAPGGGASLGAPGSATVTIVDNDQPTGSAGSLQFGPAQYLVAENGVSVAISVTRTGGSTGAVSVQYATANGTASAGSDYTTTTGTLTWAAGDAATKTFVVPIIDDTIVESNEAFTIALSSPVGGATLGTASTATVTITDDDQPPVPGTLQFGAAVYSVAENGGLLTITVTRTGGAGGAVSVQYATANGTATASSDYTATTGTLSWVNGDATPKTFTVPILDDAAVEGNETFTLTLTGATGGATLGVATATATIVDNDFPAAFGVLQFSAAQYTVAETGGTATITVSRTGGSNGAVSVQYATTNGTATAGSDYTASAGTLTWADGDASPKTFTVPILDDTAVEGNETFTLTLTGAIGGATLGPTATTTVTITDNDQPPSTGRLFAVASGDGIPSQVRVYNANGTVRFVLSPFETAFRGGVNVAVSDVNRDGTPDIVVGAGAGGGPFVKVFSGVDGSQLRAFFAYDQGFRGGVWVAAGDVDGDGFADIVTGAGAGGGPHVKAFSGANGALLRSLFAYETSFTGGTPVAAADVTGDGKADIVTGTGYGGGPVAKVFDGVTSALVRATLAYEQEFRGGVYVAAGDYDGDGKAEVVTGTGTGGGPLVKIFAGTDGALLKSLFAYEQSFRGGVRVAAADEDGDGRIDIITAPGVGGAPRVRVFKGVGLVPGLDFLAFDPSYFGGVFVG